jgi:hypothetical protein
VLGADLARAVRPGVALRVVEELVQRRRGGADAADGALGVGDGAGVRDHAADVQPVAGGVVGAARAGGSFEQRGEGVEANGGEGASQGRSASITTVAGWLVAT